MRQVTSVYFLPILQFCVSIGAENTAVTDLSCVTHFTVSSTVSLHCTWLPGKEAPEDTKYFLFYRLVSSPILLNTKFLREHFSRVF